MIYRSYCECFASINSSFYAIDTTVVVVFVDRNKLNDKRFRIKKQKTRFVFRMRHRIDLWLSGQSTNYQIVKINKKMRENILLINFQKNAINFRDQQQQQQSEAKLRKKIMFCLIIWNGCALNPFKIENQLNS